MILTRSVESRGNGVEECVLWS